MKYKLKFSIVATVTGNMLDSTYRNDYTLRDYVREFDKALGESEPTEPGNSEYHYLAKENSADGFKLTVIKALESGNRDVAIWATKPKNWVGTCCLILAMKVTICASVTIRNSGWLPIAPCQRS